MRGFDSRRGLKNMHIFQKTFWQTVAARYRTQLSDPNYHKAIVSMVALFVTCLIVNYFAALYAMERASNSVTDIVLSNIPVFDVDLVFVWGPVIFWAILAFVLFTDPKRIPYTLKAVALFVIIRSAFISLTHIGPFPDHTVIDTFGYHWLESILHTKSDLLFIISSGSDLFFSGHTGMPFLLGLIFWKDRLIRIFCIMTSLFFGVIVLLGHLHYSIDVASAFFITFAISHIAERWFKKDEQRFLGYTQI